MTLTLLDIYNQVTGQAWSVFDTDVESQEEFDSAVLSSIQKALSVIWHSHNFSFRLRQKEISIIEGKSKYIKPCGMIRKNGVRLVDGNNIETIQEIDEFDIKNIAKEKPNGFYILSDKIILNKVPDKNYKLLITYYTGKMGLNNDNISIYNLQRLDDKLDIPEQFEDLFLRALATKSMVNAIASNISRNYQPYISDFIENYRTLLCQTTGIEQDKKIEF